MNKKRLYDLFVFINLGLLLVIFVIIMIFKDILALSISLGILFDVLVVVMCILEYKARKISRLEKDAQEAKEKEERSNAYGQISVLTEFSPYFRLMNKLLNNSVKEINDLFNKYPIELGFDYRNDDNYYSVSFVAGNEEEYTYSSSLSVDDSKWKLTLGASKKEVDLTNETNDEVIKLLVEDITLYFNTTKIE